MTKFSTTLVFALTGLHIATSQAPIVVPSIAKAPGLEDTKACLKFVNEFYAWYVAAGKNSDPLRIALKKKAANFSKELVLRLNEDYQAAAKSPDEIVGLDFDPVLNSQDFAEKYLATQVTKKGSRYLVEVFATYGGKRESKPAVIPELQRVGSRWVFTNFLYKDGPKTDDLLSILKKLKAERKGR